MEPRTYTLKEIASILSHIQAGSDATKIGRQVRHWTVNGLLNPAERHTGRGRDRAYLFQEIRKAAIYLELSRYGMTVGLLKSVGDWLDFLEREKSPLWEFAKAKRYRIFMELTWDEMGQTSIMSVHQDDYKNARRAVRDFVLAAKIDRFGEGKPEGAALSQLFVNVTGVLSAIAA